MERRKFLLGVGGSAVGGSALIGSGAFSRVQSDRSLLIEVAEDPDAYLGLDECDSVHGDNYADIDDHGHLHVDIGENPNDGEGVNSNSRTWLHNVFQVCNQGKEDVCVWIEDDDDWPTVDAGPDEGERRVEFYLADDDELTVIGEDNALELDVGECVCLGIKTRTHGLSEEDTLLAELDDRITIHADVDGECFEDVTEPDCVECGPEGDASRLSWLELENTGDAKEIEVRQGRGTDDEETVFGPETVGAGETFDFDISTVGPDSISFYVDGQPIALDHTDDNPGTASAHA